MADPHSTLLVEGPALCIVTEARCGCRGGRACGETCTDCGGSCVQKIIRPATADDLVAHLQPQPDLAAEVVDRLKVARPWSGRSVTCRDRLNGEIAATLHPGESYDLVDARLAADGWTFTTRSRDG